MLDSMSRTKKWRIAESELTTSDPAPISKEQYVRETRASCRHGGCCNNQAALDAAYEQYVNDPKAPWNKRRRAPGRLRNASE